VRAVVRRSAAHQQGHARCDRPDLAADGLQEMRRSHRARVRTAMVQTLRVLALSAILAASTALGQTVNSALRGDTPIDSAGPAARMARTRNTTARETRNYPEQPPLIPHAIDGYQIDINGNKCLSCHARARTGESQAPMISITHFMDRDGQFLASVSPRRF